MDGTSSTHLSTDCLPEISSFNQQLPPRSTLIFQNSCLKSLTHSAIAIDVLNKGLRPFLVKWHPLLKSHEEQKPAEKTTLNHERGWEREKELRKELNQVREQMTIYVEALAKIAGLE